jgi:hypothetical protein
LRSLVFVADADTRATHNGTQDGFIALIEGLVAAAQQRGEINAEPAANCVAGSAFALYLWQLVQLLDGRTPSLAEATKALRRDLKLLFSGLRHSGSAG